jgi:LuxR family transcriptional regulator, maltose regulon positive regulatory protein
VARKGLAITLQPEARERRSSRPVLAATKLQAPAPREMVPRERLVDAMTSPRATKLTLVSAPAGSGKTTLLAEWQAAPAEERPFSWLSLDPSDNDTVRFLDGAIAALRTAAPGVGEAALGALTGPAGLADVVLPSLINDLMTLREPVVLVFDDYHLISNKRIHALIDLLLEHLPVTLQLAIATRGEPPLALGRLRARRQMLELGADDLRFTEVEATSLLNGILGLGLAENDIAQLQARTEGWAAGLQLAALSLSGREDAHDFISSFAGDDRPIVDYLGFEVLDGQPFEVRRFLLRTSVLDRLAGPLCDAVLDDACSDARLAELERANLFLVPLDTKREWYRYHHLFGGLLRHELARTEPDLIPELHRRASAWFRDNGMLGEAIRHSIASGDVPDASELIARHWYSFLQRGRIETVAGWLEALGDENVAGDAGLCLTKAWIAVNTGHLPDVARWTEAAEQARDRGNGGGSLAVESGVAALQEIHRYMNGDVDAAVEAGRRSVERGQTPWRPIGCPVLGIALFWSGHPREAIDELESSVETAESAGNHLSVIHATSALAAVRLEDGDYESAGELATRALDRADQANLEEHWATAMSRVVKGQVLERGGRLSEAREAVDRGVELSRGGVAAVETAYALLSQAEMRQLQGDREAATKVLREARRVVESCTRPGILEQMLARSERRLRRGPRRSRDGHPDELTDREISVLRLLPGELTQREIAGALYLSINTVKSHLKSIYRKLRVETRDDAVSRARDLGIL